MRKNNTHDYAVSALFMYAKENYPKSEDIFEKLRKAEREYLEFARENKKASKLKFRKMFEKVAEIRSVYLDVLAIEQALYINDDERSRLILECVKRVYFEEGKYGTKKGLTDSLCVRASMDLHISVSSVYIYLAEALRRFCLSRGLRIDAPRAKSIKTLKSRQ